MPQGRYPTATPVPDPPNSPGGSSRFGFSSYSFKPILGQIDGDEQLTDRSAEAAPQYNSDFVSGLKDKLLSGDIIGPSDRSNNNSYWGYQGSGMPANLNYYEGLDIDPDTGELPPEASINAPNIRNPGPRPENLASAPTFNALPSPYMPNLIPPDIHNPTEPQTDFYIFPEGASLRNDDGTLRDAFRSDINGSKRSPMGESGPNRRFARTGLPPVDRASVGERNTLITD